MPSPGSLRIGLMAQAPLGIPTDEACMAGARRPRPCCWSSSGTPSRRSRCRRSPKRWSRPSSPSPQGGLADYEGVDWSAVEPHIAHQRGQASELGAYDYVLAARTLELLSRREVARWGRDFDVLLTPTSAILPPRPARSSRPSTRRPTSRCSTSWRASRSPPSATSPACPAVSLPLHWTDEGLPVGVQLLAGPWQRGDADRAGRAAGGRSAVVRASPGRIAGGTRAGPRV